MNDYEFIDVIDHTNVTNIRELGYMNHVIYVSRTFYDEELLGGMETRKKARHQVDLDSHRCNLYINGTRTVHFPDTTSTVMMRYCTQAVMALPVKILSTFGLVAELQKGHRMAIHINGSRIFVKKNLRLFLNGWFPICIKIIVDMKESYVIIILRRRNQKNIDNDQYGEIHSIW
tara:strand:- start:1511 stop:2032 length:522 start_codon:yes stop_codon:yes gene_type:complete